jgi:hypothetical protein
MLQNGKKLRVDSIWGVHAGRLEYQLDGSLHDLDVTKLSMVQCGHRSYTLSGDTLMLVMVAGANTSLAPASLSLLEQDGGMDYRALGKADAKRYYKGGANFAVGLLTSVTFYVPILVAAVPPAAPKLKNNPNAPLYFSQPEYRKGYKAQAHRKKAGLTIGGMFVGIMFIAALAAAA